MVKDVWKDWQLKVFHGSLTTSSQGILLVQIGGAEKLLESLPKYCTILGVVRNLSCVLVLYREW